MKPEAQVHANLKGLGFEGGCKLAYGMYAFTAGQSLQCAADSNYASTLADVFLIIYNDALHGIKCSPTMTM